MCFAKFGIFSVISSSTILVLFLSSACSTLMTWMFFIICVPQALFICFSVCFFHCVIQCSDCIFSIVLPSKSFFPFFASILFGYYICSKISIWFFLSSVYLLRFSILSFVSSMFINVH